MILTFEIRVDVSDQYGKKYIPYLKHLLSGHAAPAGTISSVVCLDELITDKTAEMIEMEEWKSGRIDL